MTSLPAHWCSRASDKPEIPIGTEPPRHGRLSFKIELSSRAVRRERAFSSASEQALEGSAPLQQADGLTRIQFSVPPRLRGEPVCYS